MFGLSKKAELHAPFAGSVVDVSQVPDPVFSQKMLGEGFAVQPDDGAELIVLAPVAGEIVKVFKTGHAFAMRTDQGVEVLVHIGLETVELKGEGFNVLAESGQSVQAGEPIVKVDAVRVKAAGYNLITPIVLTKRGQTKDVKISVGHAQAQDAVCTYKLS
ncbi:PTS system glucose-specific IIA component [Arcanobacterium pluranimalium]|uniref:PTS sugar transporter subunit IIA n=1 Tax=Arcanobacterium pluranimalium TaxID=108028 RepID=UPI00195C72EC|nr:PTS glucose transporter subunit IIA [Arcanobacterium pluranimalium]MBM7825080.1 PTS system glucose-specific IIA component [Arcanobacterium pluranimalium]